MADSHDISTIRVAIVGTGLLGCTVGLGLRQLGIHCTGFDTEASVMQRAEECEAIDTYATSLAGAVNNVDVVFLATPVSAVVALVSEVARLVRKDAIITDVASTKAAIVDAMVAASAETGFDGFVGGHPMAGATAVGPESAKAQRLWRATWALVPINGSRANALEKVSMIVTALGATPLQVTAQEHDQAVARSSHLPHFAAAAVVLAALESQTIDSRALISTLSATGWESVTHLADGDSIMWRDIALSNSSAIRETLDAMALQLAKLSESLDDPDKVMSWLEAAKALRLPN